MSKAKKKKQVKQKLDDWGLPIYVDLFPKDHLLNDDNLPVFTYTCNCCGQSFESGISRDNHACGG